MIFVPCHIVLLVLKSSSHVVSYVFIFVKYLPGELEKSSHF